MYQMEKGTKLRSFYPSKVYLLRNRGWVISENSEGYAQFGA